MIERGPPGYHARVRRILARLLLGVAVALATVAGCQDDSVYRSGNPPPSVTDSGAQDGAGAGAGPDAGGSAGASGEIDGGGD